MSRDTGTAIGSVAFTCVLLVVLGGEVPAASPGPAFVLYVSAFVMLYATVFVALPKGPRWLRNPWLIVLIGIGMRLAFISFPLSDDVNRYAWEGHLIATGGNPYLHPPDAIALADPIHAGINHPDFTAAYPPLSLWAFSAVSAIAYQPHQPTHTFLVFKLLFLGTDALVLLLLVPLLSAWRRPGYWLALYALNPLVLVYGVGEGHLDVLQNLMLVLALLAFFHSRPSPRLRSALGYLALGCAVMTKYLAIILAPFLVTRRNVKWLPIACLPLLLYLPFRDAAVFDSLMRFSGDLHVNDVLPRLLRLILDGPAYRLGMILLLASGLGAIWLFKQDAPGQAMLLAWGWLLLCLPTVHPWYLLPMAILLLHTPSRAWLLLMATMGLQFWIYHGQAVTGIWRERPIIWAATWLPFFAMLCYDFGRRSFPWLTRYPQPTTVDILIPTLNESANLHACLNSIRTAIQQAGTDSSFRITVIDGGSTDGTCTLATGQDCHLIHADQCGRGNQYAQGIAATHGDLILMLHADAIMHPDALAKLLRDCRRHPTVEWGILGHVYDHRTSRMRLIELSNRLRFNLAGIAFGDQGIFIRRPVLHQVGGMPEVPLMEDVELSLRLAAAPYRLQIGSGLQVSTRTWEKKSYTGYTLQVIHLVATYLLYRRLGAHIPDLCARMYRRYYGKDPA